MRLLFALALLASASVQALTVQPVSITVPLGSYTATVTLPTAVDPSRSIVLYNGWTSTIYAGTPSPGNGFVRLALTDATHITATRNPAFTAQGDVTAYCTVIELDSSLVESAQRGSITLQAMTVNTATLATPVDTSRSVVLWLGSESDSGSPWFDRSHMSVELTGPSTVTARKTRNGSGPQVVGYEVLQLRASAVRSIQRVVSTLSGTATSTAAALPTPINPATSLTLWNGQNTSVGTVTVADSYLRAELSGDGSGVTFTRNGTGAATLTGYVTVLEFQPGIASVQRGAITTSATSATSTLATPVDAARSAVSWGSYSADGWAERGWNLLAPALTLSSTDVVALKNAAGASSTVAYEVLTFPPACPCVCP